MTQTTDTARAEFEALHKDFEAEFGKMPEHCSWTGRSFCATRHDAWQAHHYAAKFEGFKAAWQAARRTHGIT